MTSQTQTKEFPLRPWRRSRPLSLLLGCAAVVLMTGLIQAYNLDTSFSNVSMLYLIVVTVTALFLGRASAVLAAILSFLSFNWFFVDPRYGLNVRDPAEWLALCVFLLTAILIGQLTALLNMRMEEANRSKAEAVALAQATWSMAKELSREKALQEVLRELAPALALGSASIVSISENNEPQILANYSQDNEYQMPEEERLLLDQLRNGDLKLPDTITRNGNRCQLPIRVEGKPVAILNLELPKRDVNGTEQEHLIDALTNHVTLVLQRDVLMKADAKSQALAEADRLKTALLSMVSHDFRSPLTSIKTSVGSLLHDSESGRNEIDRELLETVEHETDRLNRMVGNILDLSRLESGVWKPRREMLPVAELIGATLDTFSDAENARIQIDIPDGKLAVWGDSVQIVQVLINLVENALKYAPDGVIELKSYGAGETAVIEILDRGRGLPFGDMDRIFESFFRPDDLAESAIPGVGIGLAVCFGLTQANGGRISAKDREGGGAVFKLELPVALNVESNEQDE